MCIMSTIFHEQSHARRCPSARAKPEEKYYKLTEDVAKELVKKGFGVTTGGGSGIMEAGNKGAMDAEGSSTGRQKGNGDWSIKSLC